METEFRRSSWVLTRDFRTSCWWLLIIDASLHVDMFCQLHWPSSAYTTHQTDTHLLSKNDGALGWADNQPKFCSVWHNALASVHYCISSIGQIIKSVCVSVSESVCHTKRVERSTDRNLPPIFTKLATKVETQEMWLSIVVGGNPIYFYPPNRKWN